MKKFCLILFLFILTFSTGYAKPIEISFNDGIYHIVLKGEKIKKKIKFVASEGLITNREAHFRAKSILTINTGFFDPNNGKTISYIVTDRNTSADPLFNDNLLNNPILRQNFDKILNRTEFRIIECDNKYQYQIAPHKDNIEFGCNLITSAQGGPLLLPEMRMEEELFIIKDENGNIIRESASVLHPVARTIIGTKDNEAHILIITDEHPMTLYEVRELCIKLGLNRAMAFDGGSSTSMNYKKEIEVISTIGDGAGRSLKSFMIIKK